MIQANQFTRDFWSAPFSGYRSTFDWNNIQQGFYSTKHLPYWSIDFGFDPGPTLDWLHENDNLFVDNFYITRIVQRFRQAGHDWFYDVGTAENTGSTLIKVCGQRYTGYATRNGPEMAEPDTEPSYEIPCLLDFLQKISLPVVHVSVHRWAPGGFLWPHTDRLQHRDKIRNCHVYIPLDNWSGALKILPVGVINMLPGHFHFFNNYDFPHSVWNQTDRVQYAITLTIDHTKLSEDLDRIIRTSAHDKWITTV